MDLNRVVEDGLPQAPSAPLPRDTEVPVAVWRRGNHAAVLLVSRDEAHASDEGDSPFSQYIAFVVRTADGWASAGLDGGSDWPVPYGDRLDPLEPRLTGFSSGLPLGRAESLWLSSGIAPIGASHVVAITGRERQEVPVEPVSGAFLIRHEPFSGHVTLTTGSA